MPKFLNISILIIIQKFMMNFKIQSKIFLNQVVNLQKLYNFFLLKFVVKNNQKKLKRNSVVSLYNNYNKMILYCLLKLFQIWQIKQIVKMKHKNNKISTVINNKNVDSVYKLKVVTGVQIRIQRYVHHKEQNVKKQLKKKNNVQRNLIGKLIKKQLQNIFMETNNQIFNKKKTFNLILQIAHLCGVMRVFHKNLDQFFFIQLQQIQLNIQSFIRIIFIFAYKLIIIFNYFIPYNFSTFNLNVIYLILIQNLFSKIFHIKISTTSLFRFGLRFMIFPTCKVYYFKTGLSHIIFIFKH